jgi:hypothetical protein
VRRYPTVYRSPRVWQVVIVGVWIELVPELEGMAHFAQQPSWCRFHRAVSPTQVDFVRLSLYNAFAYSMACFREVPRSKLHTVNVHRCDPISGLDGFRVRSSR